MSSLLYLEGMLGSGRASASHRRTLDVAELCALLEPSSTAPVEAVKAFTDDDLEDLPPCHSSACGTLAGVVVYVEVFSNGENRSALFAKELRFLGATVSRKWSRRVTHLVFSDGNPATLQRAKERNIFIVSPLWVDDCKARNQRSSESVFLLPGINGADADDGAPSFLLTHPTKTEKKLRPINNMIPRCMALEIALSEDKLRQRKKRQQMTALKKHVAGYDPSPRHHSLSFSRLSFSMDPRIESSAEEDSSDESLAEKPLGDAESVLTRLKAKLETLKTGEDDDETTETQSLPLLSLLPKRAVPKKSYSRASSISMGPVPVSKGRRRASGFRDVSVNTSDWRTSTSRGEGNVCKAEQPDSTEEVADGVGRLVLAEEKKRPVRRRLLWRPDRPLMTPPTPDEETEDKPTIQTLRITQQRHRSSMDFIASVHRRRRRRRQVFHSSIALTHMERTDREAAAASAKSLGGFRLGVSGGVTDATSHVVCGAGKRTLAVIHGIVRGCWILPLQWIYRSLEAGRWLPEGDFELHAEFPAAKRRRVEKAHGRCSRLFSSMGPMYVSPQSSPPPSDVATFIRLSGGRVAPTLNRAAICVGPFQRKGGCSLKAVSEKWVLDSVTSDALHPMDEYMI